MPSVAVSGPGLAGAHLGVGSAGIGAPHAGALLSEPTPLSTSGLQDAMGTLYALMFKESQNDLSASSNLIQGQSDARHVHQKLETEALARERAAEGQGSRGFFASIGHLVSDVCDDLVHLRIADALSDAKDDVGDALASPQFWKDLACGATSVLRGAETLMASVVALYVAGPAGVAYILDKPDSPGARACAVGGQAALTAVTLGAAAPILVTSAIAMSVGGYVVSETKCLGNASAGVGLSLAIMGGACSTGAAITASASAVTNAERSVKSLEDATRVISGSAKVVRGAADAEVSGFEGAAMEAKADAQGERFCVQTFRRAVEWILDDAKANKEAHEHALSTLQGAMDINNRTIMAGSATTLRG